MMYAAKVENGVVTNVIVGDAGWAESRIGGMWVGSHTLVGIGWLHQDGVLVPPPAPEPDVFTGDLL